MPKYEVKDTTNAAGYRVRVQVPAGKAVTRGIPISVDFEALAQAFDLPFEVASLLQERLWQAKIITPRDFQMGAVYDALYSAVRAAYPDMEKRQAALLSTSMISRVRSNV